MKKLFQNKNFLLFTLILVVSCFGILGVGGEVFAAKDYRCDNNNITYDRMTANDWCSAKRGDCDDENNYDYAFCVENNQKSVKFGCEKKVWLVVTTCDCKRSLFEIDDCPNGCANGKCKMSSTPPAAACESVSGQICCDAEDCSAFVTSGPRECSSGFCCKAKYCKCESVSDQVCYDTSQCKEYSAVTSGPRDCSGNLICIQKGSCIPKTTTGCTDGECNYFTKKYCDDGTWSSSKYCANCSNHCGDGDCNCGETTTSCSADCGAAPASIVPVIPQQPPPTGSGGNSGVSDTGPSTDPGASGGAVSFNNPLSTNSFEALVMGIINWILGIVVSLAILFLIIGGLMYIVSAGDEERIKKAKNIILYSVIGLGVVILSWSIITELKDILGVK